MDTSTLQSDLDKRIELFAKPPETWEDLETLVQTLLSRIGFVATRKKVVKLVRGSAEVDVHAVRKGQSFNIVILCECKWWNKKVPQSVVHSFRSVMADCGANLGLIITKKGYQKGAWEAAENTNLKIATWESFLSDFRQEYISTYVLPRISELTDSLFKSLSGGLFRALIKERRGAITWRMSGCQLLERTYFNFLFLCKQYTTLKLELLPKVLMQFPGYIEYTRPIAIQIKSELEVCESFEDLLNIIELRSKEIHNELDNLLRE